MNTTDDNNTNQGHELDAEAILATLEITKVERRKMTDRVWVSGRIAGHRFQALVFPNHAEVASYELDDSRISKLWLRGSEGEVACFDRGWDREPATETAALIVELLAAGLAEHVFGN